MKRLKVEHLGTHAQGVILHGDPKSPEPESFRVIFPGGELDLQRCTDGSYWAHVHVNRPESVTTHPDDKLGRLVDARVDVHGEHASETRHLAGAFRDPATYHVAIRVSRADD